MGPGGGVLLLSDRARVDRCDLGSAGTPPPVLAKQEQKTIY